MSEGLEVARLFLDGGLAGWYRQGVATSALRSRSINILRTLLVYFGVGLGDSGSRRHVYVGPVLAWFGLLWVGLGS